jgi:casein kinase II subunit alpha
MSRGRAIQRDNPTYTIETISRIYPDVNTDYGPTWYDHEHWELPKSSPDGYEIAEWIGTGKYSDVFKGYHNGELVALKVMKPVRAVKYNREAKILFNLQDGPNIIKLLDIVQNPESHQLTFVFEHASNADFSELAQSTSEFEVKYYLYQLMRALQYSHAHGIMHRDIKPQNIIYNRETRQLRLIDWGLAEFYHPHRRYNIHVASRHFKAIELLVDYQFYDYSIDIWGFGATMAGIIFQRAPFFRGTDDFDMVARITSVLGTDAFDKYVKKYGIQVPADLQVQRSRGKKWSSFVREGVQFASQEAIDLISQCLRYDHMERITAEQALQHPYFADVRNADENHVEEE